MNIVDWDLAQSTAARLVRPGPEISRDGAAAVVADLRDCAARAEAYVQSVTGLVAPSGSAPVLVVDRPRWIQANLDGFRQVLSPLNAKAEAKLSSQHPAVVGVGSRLTGLEVGVLMSYLAPRVLGQFDPFYPGPGDAQGQATGGRLLLVAPNVVTVERELGLVPHDFRLWVCLHEETHRVQFSAVPWLRDNLTSLIEQLVSSTDLEASVLTQLVRQGVSRVREAAQTGEEISVVDLVQTPEQRAVVDQITAVMSLLEGHADVVMDQVGPDVIGSIASIRRKFDTRRAGQGFDKLIRKLIGLDAKMRQYRDGAAFCTEVMAAVGMAGLNTVWESPQTLPTRDELMNPSTWLSRVQPTAAAR